MSDPKQLLTEDLVSISQAAKALPNRPHVSTVWRWTRRGIGGKKLSIIKIGGHTYTSVQALTRFLDSTQEVAK